MNWSRVSKHLIQFHKFYAAVVWKRQWQQLSFMLSLLLLGSYSSENHFWFNLNLIPKPPGGGGGLEPPQHPTLTRASENDGGSNCRLCYRRSCLGRIARKTTFDLEHPPLQESTYTFVWSTDYLTLYLQFFLSKSFICCKLTGGFFLSVNHVLDDFCQFLTSHELKLITFQDLFLGNTW